MKTTGQVNLEDKEIRNLNTLLFYIYKCHTASINILSNIIGIQ